MPTGFGIELRGLESVDKLFLRLTDFDKLVRIPLSAAGGEAKTIMAGQVGSRKAAKAMKVRVRKETAGLKATIGPVGGDQRPGYLAALFLETGTGVYGPKHRRITPQHGHAFAFWSQRQVTSRFGPSAQLFTQSGRLRRAAFSRFGNAGQVVVRSTSGSPARPWFDRSVRQALPRVQEAFSGKLHEVIGGG